MRFITLDIGNTTIDLVLWKNRTPEGYLKLNYEELKDFRKLALKGVGISVKPSAEELIRKKFPRVRLLERKDIPLKIFYKTPETLGIDRVALAYAVREVYSKNAVIVSCGTALFVDLLLDGVFWGGFISLGIGKKLECILSLTEGIKNLKFEEINVEIGKSTRECVVGGIIKESRTFIESVIQAWKREFGRDFLVVVTGGEGKLFKDLGIYDPIILHKGLRLLL